MGTEKNKKKSKATMTSNPQPVRPFKKEINCLFVHNSCLVK